MASISSSAWKSMSSWGRHKVEHHQSDEHDAHCNADAQPDRFHDALFTAGPVVVGHNGYHAVVQSEYRHEDKALKLEIYSEYGYGCLGKSNQDFIHPKGHDRADGLHDNRGNAYLVDNGNSSPVRGERTEINPHLLVFGVVQDEGQEHGHNLAEYSGCGSSLDSHFRHSKQAEDKNGVQYNIDDGPGALCNHTVKGLARGLENPLEHHFPKQAKAENTYNLQVLDSIFNDNRVVCLAFKEETRPEYPKQGKEQKAYKGQEQSIDSGQVGIFGIPFPQGAGQKGIDAHTGSGGHCNQQVLDGECHGDSSEGRLVNHGYKYAVHDVVQRLDQHGDDHWQGHGDQQPLNGHGAHLIFL